MNLLQKIGRVVFNLITYFLITILAIYVCLVAYQKIISKNDLLNIGKYYIFQIASSSMEANLHIGDYIVVLKTADYKEGDIITFKTDDIYITHRIYKLEGEKIITKGDANSTIDESINKEDILGKVLFKADILSFIVKYKFVLIIIILILLVLDELLKVDNKKDLLTKEIISN